MSYGDSLEISKITPNLFLSGILPLETNDASLHNLNIDAIVSCVPINDNIRKIYNRIKINNPRIIVLHIPYNDNVYQNLWDINRNQVVISYQFDNENVKRLRNYYENKYMIEIAYNFLTSQVASNNRVLVHCMAGVSRSVSVLSYYFMRTYNLPLDDVLRFIRTKRAVIRPNLSFYGQLTLYEFKKDTFTKRDADLVIEDILTGDI